MAESQDKLWNSAAAKLFKIIAPMLIGWLGATVMNSRDDHAQVKRNTDAITSIQEEMKQGRDVYATNKRVDDVQNEMRTNYRDLSSKIDQLIKLIVERR